MPPAMREENHCPRSHAARNQDYFRCHHQYAKGLDWGVHPNRLCPPDEMASSDSVEIAQSRPVVRRFLRAQILLPFDFPQTDGTRYFTAFGR